MRTFIVSLVALLLGSGCLTAHRSMEIRIHDLDDVELNGGKDPPALERNGKDIRVAGRSILDEGKVRTVTHRIQGFAPSKVPTNDEGQYEWRSTIRTKDGDPIDVRATTALGNIERAEIVTDWDQPLDIVPSLGAIVFGGAFALGFGAAAIGTAQDGFAADDPDLLLESAGFAAGASAGALLLAYGIVSWALVDGAPTRTELDLR